jgi:hypothetical protein
MDIEGRGVLYTDAREKLADVDYLIVAKEGTDAAETRIAQVHTDRRIFPFGWEMILETEGGRYTFSVTTKFPDHKTLAGYVKPA